MKHQSNFLQVLRILQGAGNSRIPGNILNYPAILGNPNMDKRKKERDYRPPLKTINIIVEKKNEYYRIKNNEERRIFLIILIDLRITYDISVNIVGRPSFTIFLMLSVTKLVPSPYVWFFVNIVRDLHDFRACVTNLSLTSVSNLS